MRNNMNYNSNFPNFEQFTSSFKKNNSASYNDNLNDNICNSERVFGSKPNGNFDWSYFENFNKIMENFSKKSNSDNSNSFNNNSTENNPFGSLDINTVMKMKQLVDGMNNGKNSPRSKLLLSLKPYLRSDRKKKIDQYIQFFAISDVLENLKSTGGEKIK